MYEPELGFSSIICDNNHILSDEVVCIIILRRPGKYVIPGILIIAGRMKEDMLNLNNKKVTLGAVVLSLLITLLMITDSYAASVTVDGNVKHQVIDGFEVTVMGLEDPTSFGAPIPDIAQQLVNDFGFNFIKIRLSLDNAETVNDNADPLTFNNSAYNSYFSQQSFVNFFQSVKAFHDAGAKIHLSPWTPPAWMRETLPGFTDRWKLKASYPRPALYQEIAELWAALLVHMRDQYSVEVESIVVWNEPLWYEGPFTFTVNELVATIDAMGQRFASENLATKIFISDDSIDESISVAQSVMASSASQYAGGIAYHTYHNDGGGFERTEPDNMIGKLTNIGTDSTVASSGLGLRMTEWAPSVGHSSMSGQPLVWAKHIHNTHVYGRTSVVDLWALTPIVLWGDGDPDSISEFDGSGGIQWKKNVYAFKQFAKYISPGSKRINASVSGASSVYASTYLDESTGRFTVVVINRGTGSHSTSFNISGIQGLSTLNVIRTSAAENAADLGTVSVGENSFNYTVPGESITTFTGTVGAPDTLPPSNPTGLS